MNQFGSEVIFYGSDEHWIRWTDKIKELLQIESLDGNQEEDGYSLAVAKEAYLKKIAPSVFVYSCVNLNKIKFPIPNFVTPLRKDAPLIHPDVQISFKKVKSRRSFRYTVPTFQVVINGEPVDRFFEQIPEDIIYFSKKGKKFLEASSSQLDWNIISEFERVGVCGT